MKTKPAVPLLLLIPDESSADYSFVYNIATAYAHSGLMISEYANKKNDYTFSFPAVVCSSFAIELFLKFFLIFEKSKNISNTSNKISGHRLMNLWNGISENNQKFIAGMFRNPTKEPLLNSYDSRKKIFELALNEVGDSPFVKWRYAHEIYDVTLMSHDAIVEVLDALGYAAEYVIKKQL